METVFQKGERSIDETGLIASVLSGKTNAYAEIVRAYQAKVLGLCTSLLGNVTEGEDAAQEVFIKAYQSLRSFRGDSGFSTWLYRITANHCKDLLRKRSREKTQSLEALVESAGESAGQILEPSSNPMTAVESADTVEKILSLLSADERLILTLREAQGLSYEEISQTLGCSLEAVRSRLRRAREALQEKLRHFSVLKNV